MRVALVHDYLNEFGGAERVLAVLAEMFPQAPIYTAFVKEGSAAMQALGKRQIMSSWAQKIPGFASKLHSPLRFLAPLIWESFNLDDYEVVISSASWYITKGILTRPETVHICYCHTPPRYLYGYETSIDWRKWWPVRVYAGVVNKRLREYDYLAAQRVDYFVANSKNVQARIKKFYGRESEVVYPPVGVNPKSEIRNSKSKGYYLVVSRVVGGKGLSMAVEVANKLKFNLKVVGRGAGWSREEQKLRQMAGETVEFLGWVSDEELAGWYAGAKGFLALAKDEDFGITPVEAMMMGVPVVAYNGGGYKETVVEGKTGVLFEDYSAAGLVAGIKRLEARKKQWDERLIRRRAQKFGKRRFMDEMMKLVVENYEQRQKELSKSRR